MNTSSTRDSDVPEPTDLPPDFDTVVADNSLPPEYDAAVEAGDIAVRYGLLKLSNACPTPKLKSLLDQVLASAARHSQESTDPAEMARSVDEFEKYWDFIMATPRRLSLLLRGMMLYKDFITKSLFQDYSGKVSRDWDKVNPIFPAALLVGSPVQRAQAVATLNCGQEKDALKVHIHFPLEQMCLDVDHIISKLKAFVAAEGRIRSIIQVLVNQKDYEQLARTINKDKQLIAVLKASGTITDLHYSVYSKGIERIQNQNFHHMVDEKCFKPR